MKLKEAWKLEVGKYTKSPSKSFFFQQVPILKELISKAPTNVIEAEYRRICNANISSVSKNPSDLDGNYDNVLLEALVDRSIDGKDASRLVSLVSSNCPRYIANVPLEFRLAEKWRGSIGLLFDCYKRSNSSRVKEDIATCLGRAFASLRERVPVTAKFIEEAEKWYAENQIKLELNERYPYLPDQPPSSVPQDKDLFILKQNR